jgi:uncharacterized protein
MKKLMVGSIAFYQHIISPLLTQILGVQYICRYSPTCSEYTKQAIQKKGVIIGLYLGAKRILSCQPFSKKTYGRSL